MKTWEDIEKIFPAGSHTNTGPEHAQLLYKYSLATTGSGEIVEIGTNVGESTIALAFGQKQKSGRPIHTVDIYANASFKKNVENADVRNYVDQIVQSSQLTAKRWSKPIELLFIDGDHSYAGVLADIRSWAPHVQTGGLLILDDYPGHYGSTEVWRAAYNQLLKRPKSWRVVSDRILPRMIIFQKLDSRLAKRPVKSFWYWRYRDLRAIFFRFFPKLSHTIVQKMKDKK